MVFLFYFVVFLFILLCATLGLSILVQESKSLGLGASFGGDAGSSLFGTSTADVLKKTTAWLAVIFFASCLFLSYWAAGISQSPISPEAVIEGASS